MGSLLLLAACGTLSRAEAPRTLSFQGILAAPGGAPQPDGDYTVTFRLYDAVANGNLLWTEADRVVSVAGGQGRFATLLGDPTPFAALAFDVPYFLEVEVSGEGAPMTPRIALSSAPYALNTGGGATLSLPFQGSLSTDASTAIALENTGAGGIGVRSITPNGRSFWGTTGGSYAVYAEALTTGTGVQGVAGYTTIRGRRSGAVHRIGTGAACHFREPCHLGDVHGRQLWGVH